MYLYKSIRKWFQLLQKKIHKNIFKNVQINDNSDIIYKLHCMILNHINSLNFHKHYLPLI